MLLQHTHGLHFPALQITAFLPGKTNGGNADLFAFKKVTVLFDLQRLHVQPAGLTALRTTVTAVRAAACTVYLVATGCSGLGGTPGSPRQADRDGQHNDC